GEVFAGADQLLDVGPRAGAHGGHSGARGTPAEIGKQKTSVTGPYLTGTKAIAVPKNRRTNADFGLRAADSKKSAAKQKKQGKLFQDGPPSRQSAIRNPQSELLTIVGATHNNLRNVTVDIPLG